MTPSVLRSECICVRRNMGLGVWCCTHPPRPSASGSGPVLRRSFAARGSITGNTGKNRGRQEVFVFIEENETLPERCNACRAGLQRPSGRAVTLGWKRCNACGASDRPPLLGLSSIKINELDRERKRCNGLETGRCRGDVNRCFLRRFSSVEEIFPVIRAEEMQRLEGDPPFPSAPWHYATAEAFGSVEHRRSCTANMEFRDETKQVHVVTVGGGRGLMPARAITDRASERFGEAALCCYLSEAAWTRVVCRGPSRRGIRRASLQGGICDVSEEAHSSSRGRRPSSPWAQRRVTATVVGAR